VLAADSYVSGSANGYEYAPLWTTLDPKTILAFLLIGGLIAGWLLQKWLGITEFPDWLKMAVGTVIGFYFRDKRTVH